MKHLIKQFNELQKHYEKLSETFSQVSGHEVPVYQMPRIINSRAALVYWIEKLTSECAAMEIRIEIAKEIGEIHEIV